MLTLPILRKMLLNAAVELKANSTYLCELDSVAGDGDHGITIGRMADVMKTMTEEDQPNTMHDLLDELGDAFMGINGGSAGPLWGTIFSGMAEGIEDQAELTELEFRKMFVQAKEDFMDISKAQVGDKTMVDALYPALDTAIAAHGTLKEIMDAAAAAAVQGAESTSQLVAKFGRAKNMGERSLGTKDPGAVSIAILFSAMAQAV
ncbi:dihydroxyacetone kinase subunit DhaL [uncultured Phascolarctobacterium sp.]|uniref:dihydroxyacetone kinase subunit DhaL n=1 Tax=Phascolarctobacterium sp. TaxID=2049039 RepID=UPI0025D7D53D|nr:dihydroxyacetone kinase subunit DhaL [uncultured Phascolarctobacterium sp.]